MKELVENLPPKVKKLTMSTYDRLLAEGEIIGARKEKLKSAIKSALSAIIELPQLSNKKIAKIIDSEEELVQKLRTSLKEKKLTKLNQAILKEFQKIDITDHASTVTAIDLAKKYYLLFHKAETL